MRTIAVALASVALVACSGGDNEDLRQWMNEVSKDVKGGGLQPDMDRPREPLESYPLESLKYVGVMSRKKVSFAIILVDGALYQVRVGNYMGQNFGVITKITDSELTLKELIQDSAGDWVERESSLLLQGQEGIK